MLPGALAGDGDRAEVFGEAVSTIDANEGAAAKELVAAADDDGGSGEQAMRCEVGVVAFPCAGEHVGDFAYGVADCLIHLSGFDTGKGTADAHGSGTGTLHDGGTGQRASEPDERGNGVAFEGIDFAGEGANQAHHGAEDFFHGPIQIAFEPRDFLFYHC